MGRKIGNLLVLAVVQISFSSASMRFNSTKPEFKENDYKISNKYYDLPELFSPHTVLHGIPLPQVWVVPSLQQTSIEIDLVSSSNTDPSAVAVLRSSE